MNEHWLILGASSAIARAFIRITAARGAAVTLAGRDTEDLQASARDAELRGASMARVIHCDATDAVSRAACIADATIPNTTLNVLVAIGDMPDQVTMDVDPVLLARMIETNYAGPVALLQGLTPEFERQRGGCVVIIGSVAGDRGRRKNYLYGSAKAGLATYAEGLRARLFKAQATVTLIKPGFIDTPMTWGINGLFLVSSPEKCATAILRAAKKGRVVIYHPFFWWFIMLVIKHIPTNILKRLNF
ncbi:MAG: SDR family NAD(P)-dependent oxidoreductase [Steroidobacteraceae bacterium]